jgi:hypothetical protein
MKNLTKTCINTTLLVFLLLISVHAKGAFVNGIETFDGSAKDTDTWEEWIMDGIYGGITQNDRLTIATCSDYTTRTITVGIHEGVSVEVYYANPLEMRGSATLCLTDNSAGITNDTGFDTNRLYIEYEEQWGSITGGYGVYGAWMQQNYFYGTPTTPNAVILELRRLSSTTAECSAYDLEWNKLGSFIITTPAMPKDLYISLHACLNGSYAFDNVTLQEIPTTITLLSPKGGEAYAIGTANMITGA